MDGLAEVVAHLLAVLGPPPVPLLVAQIVLTDVVGLAVVAFGPVRLLDVPEPVAQGEAMMIAAQVRNRRFARGPTDCCTERRWKGVKPSSGVLRNQGACKLNGVTVHCPV